jgi:hypothetical protein
LSYQNSHACPTYWSSRSALPIGARRSLPHWPCLPVPHNGPTSHSSVAARLLGPPCRPPRSVTNIGAPNRPFVGPPCRSALPPLMGPASRPPYRSPRSALPAGPSHRSSQIGPAARPFLSAHCFGHAGRVYCPPDHSFLGGPVCRHLRSIPITRYCLTRTLMPALLIGPPDRPSLSVPRRSLPHWPCLPVPHNGPTCHSSVAARLLGPPCRPPRSVTNIGAPNRPFVAPPCRSVLPP